jgi:DNA-binding transcriptional MerR regulator
MSNYSIKDLEQLSGIKAHTIRIWEQRYNLLSPARTDTNIRTYSSDDLKTILNVSLLNKYGYKISHIDKLSASQIEEKIQALHQIDAQKEKVVNTLIKEMVSLDMYQFEKQLDFYIGQNGVEKTIVEIIFPFLEKVGILWMTNHINPAQEHLATNIIRQKIILGIEKLPHLNSPQSERVIMFMPEGEFHEIGLLFVCFVLKSKGIQVDYLGANVPIADILYVANHHQSKLLYTHLTAPTKQFKIQKFLEQLKGIDSSIKVVLSGQYLSGIAKNMPSNIIFTTSIQQTLDLLISNN